MRSLLTPSSSWRTTNRPKRGKHCALLQRMLNIPHYYVTRYIFCYCDIVFHLKCIFVDMFLTLLETIGSSCCRIVFKAGGAGNPIAKLREHLLQIQLFILKCPCLRKRVHFLSYFVHLDFVQPSRFYISPPLPFMPIAAAYFLISPAAWLLAM